MKTTVLKLQSQNMRWIGLTALLPILLIACGGDSEEAPRPTSAVKSTPPQSSAVQQSRTAEEARPTLVSSVAPSEAPDHEEPTTPRLSESEISLASGRDAYGARDYGRATLILESLIDRGDTSPWTRYLLGLSAWKSGDHETSVDALRSTIELDPGFERGYVNLARVLIEDERPADALQVLTELSSISEPTGETLRLEGNALLSMGNHEGASEAYRAALTQDAQDSWSANGLGLALIRMGLFEDAILPLAHAVALAPETPVFRNNLGIALERTEYYGDAQEQYRAALALQPAYSKAEENLNRLEERGSSPITQLSIDSLSVAFDEVLADWRSDSEVVSLEVGAEIDVAEEFGQPTDTTGPGVPAPVEMPSLQPP